MREIRLTGNVVVKAAAKRHADPMTVYGFAHGPIADLRPELADPPSPANPRTR
jgi:hypothetical protein